MHSVIQDIMDIGGPAQNVLKDTLTVIPVDNIDKGAPKASVTVRNLEGTMWNGTAYSAINPAPFTLKNDNFVTLSAKQKQNNCDQNATEILNGTDSLSSNICQDGKNTSQRFLQPLHSSEGHSSSSGPFSS